MAEAVAEGDVALRCCLTRFSVTSTPSRRPQPEGRRRPPSRTASTSATATSRSLRPRRHHGRPQGPRHKVRETYVQGRGHLDVVAVECDASGKAWERVLPRRASAAPAPASPRQLSPKRPRPTPPGEQAVLCGGNLHLIQAGFETRWLPARDAYFEVRHEMRHRRPHQRGWSPQRWSCSDTAEYGDYVSGPRHQRVSKDAMAFQADIQMAIFARKFIAD